MNYQATVHPAQRAEVMVATVLAPRTWAATAQLLPLPPARRTITEVVVQVSNVQMKVNIELC